MKSWRKGGMLGSATVIAPLVVALAVVAAALGVASYATAAAPRDQVTATAAQVRLPDLPPGWRTAVDDSKSTPSKCLDTTRIAKPSGKSSRDFAKGTIAEVAGRVGVYRSEATAKRIFAALTADRTWTCLADEMKEATDAKKLVQGRFLLQPVGAPAIGREIVATYSQNGMTASVYVHVDLARVGRGVFLLFQADAFSPALTLSEESSVMRRVVGRLRDGI